MKFLQQMRQCCRVLILMTGLFATTSAAYPKGQICDETLLPSSHEQREFARRELIKVYVLLNMAFPQSEDGIAGGLTAFYLSHPIEISDFNKKFEPSELNEIKQNMDRAHAQHNVKADVPEFILQHVTGTFLSGTQTRASRTILALLPQHYQRSGRDAFDLVRRFYTDPDFTEQVELSKSYATTVMQALRSKQSIELSKSYRQFLKDRSNATGDVVTGKVLQERLKILIAAKLIDQHPELAQEVSHYYDYKFGRPVTRAELIWSEMTRSDLQQSFSSHQVTRDFSD